MLGELEDRLTLAPRSRLDGGGALDAPPPPASSPEGTLEDEPAPPLRFNVLGPALDGAAALPPLLLAAVLLGFVVVGKYVPIVVCPPPPAEELGAAED